MISDSKYTSLSNPLLSVEPDHYQEKLFEWMYTIQTAANFRYLPWQQKMKKETFFSTKPLNWCFQILHSTAYLST